MLTSAGAPRGPVEVMDRRTPRTPARAAWERSSTCTRTGAGRAAAALPAGRVTVIGSEPGVTVAAPVAGTITVAAPDIGQRTGRAWSRSPRCAAAAVAAWALRAAAAAARPCAVRVYGRALPTCGAGGFGAPTAEAAWA